MDFPACTMEKSNHEFQKFWNEEHAKSYWKNSRQQKILIEEIENYKSENRKNEIGFF